MSRPDACSRRPGSARWNAARRRTSKKTSCVAAHPDRGIQTERSRTDALTVMLEESHPVIDPSGTDPLFLTAPEALLVAVGDAVVAANPAAIELIGGDPIGGALSELMRGWPGDDPARPLDAILVREGREELPVEVR